MLGQANQVVGLVRFGFGIFCKNSEGRGVVLQGAAKGLVQSWLLLLCFAPWSKILRHQLIVPLQ